MSQWCVYLVRDPGDSTRGYVGQTVRSPEHRAAQHCNTARRGSPLAVHRWLAGLLEAGREPLLTVLGTAQSKDEANQLEQSWMRWARKGLRLVLLNRRRAGAGVYDGEALSESVRLALKDPTIHGRMLANRKDPKHRAARAEGIRLSWNKPGRRIQQAERINSLTQTPGWKAAHAMAMADPILRGRRSIQMTAVNSSSARRDLVREASKARWKDPQYAAARRSELESQKERAEYKEARRSQMKAMWSDPLYAAERRREIADRAINPKYREACSSRMKARWEDPAYRERMTTGRRKVAVAP